MTWWIDFKKQYEPGSVLDLVVDKKVPPGFLFFNITDQIEGSLHVSELNWNFGLSQADFRNIQIGSKLRLYVIGFDDRYKKVHLGRKLLPSIEKPSHSAAWRNLVLQRETTATVFEELRNKVIVQFDSMLYATIPLLDGKSYRIGSKVQVIPIRKIADQNIIECILLEIVVSTEEQSANVIETYKDHTPENDFATSEFCLNSFQQLSESLYWNYFTEEEQGLLKGLFDETRNLFSKVEKGKEPLHIEFDFDYNGYNDFTRNIAPAIFNSEKFKSNFIEKNLLAELSKFSFWYTQFDYQRKFEGTDQSITEKTFSLFNENLSIRGNITEDGALKIRFIKAKIKTDLLKEKQNSLKRYDVFYINRPIIFAQFAPQKATNKSFVKDIDNKLVAFKIFEAAKAKSLDILQKQGKEFKIFSKFLESQIDFEVKSANDTEIQLKECKLELDIQIDGITFTGLAISEHGIQIDDKVAISNRTEEEKPRSIGSGTVRAVNNGRIEIKSNIESYELIQRGCFIKRISSIKQHVVQLDVLNSFFINKLPLDTFYKVFHDKDGIEPPEKVDVKFDNPIFEGKENPQTLAIRKAVGNKNILLIQGPPGTGKTTVITEIVKQLVKRGQRVLVTSQTHIAVDNVLERIKDDTRISIARIGNPETASDVAVPFLVDESRKRFAEKVQKIVDLKIELLNHHNQGRDISEISKLSFDLPLTFNWQNIEDFIALVRSSNLDQTSSMIGSLEQWKEVIAKTPKLLTDIFLQDLNVLFGTCIGIATSRELAASELSFDAVILDEAGKANISETLTAISKAKRIILVGDHKQLPPYLDRERVEYFKKYSRDFSEQRTSDSEIKQALGGSFFEYLQKDGVLSNENKIMLAEQHRMHPDIGNFVSQTFYDSELLNGEHTHENVISLPEPFQKQITFIDTSSDKSSMESFKDGSYFNEVEAGFIVNKIVPELGRNNIDIRSFAIVSPYKRQCERIRELLFASKTQDANLVEVATLDSFQGREHDIIIFSFTRSAIDKKVGFLDDARRLNVAFSRAKKKLILIGNVETLTSMRSHYDLYYTTLFLNLRRYASRYGRVYKINELDSRRLQTEFKVGSVVKATVRRFESYGVLVNLGTSRGLIPMRELSWQFVKTPTDILELNQTIEAKVIGVTEKGVLLSLKENIPRPSRVNRPRNNQAFPKKKGNGMDLFKRDFKALDEVEASIVEIVESNLTLVKVFVEMKYGVQGCFFTSSKNHSVKKGNKIMLIVDKIDHHNQIVECKLKP